jgi:hypothetical protein
MTVVPTRWRTALEDQLRTAEQRIGMAERHLASGDGSRALQEAYPAVVATATVQVWLEAPPWVRPVPPVELQRRVREAFPNLFAAMATLDLKDVLTSPWQPAAAEPYVREAKAFLEAIRTRYDSWLAQS